MRAGAAGLRLAIDLRSIGAVLVASLAVLALGCGPGSSPPNVLLISIDSLRADRLGCYGNSHATSPMLDYLAAHGVLFEQAISPTSWTLPAHATLLTGLAQHHHQAISVDDKLAPSIERLPEVFQRSGYETIGFYSGPFLHPAFGFGSGFDSYVSCEAETTADLKDDDVRDASHGDRTNDLIYAAFKSWLDRRPSTKRPFFAFVHMWDVHYDYIPPEPYATMFDPDYEGSLDGREIMGRGFPLDAPRATSSICWRYMTARSVRPTTRSPMSCATSSGRPCSIALWSWSHRIMATSSWSTAERATGVRSTRSRSAFH